MATTLKTPTRTVALALTDPRTGIDWSGDYVGNNRPATLRRDPEGTVDYLCDDAEATWWERQCAAQQEADDALAGLTDAQREAIADDLDRAGHLDLGDQPAAVMAAIESVDHMAGGRISDACGDRR